MSLTHSYNGTVQVESQDRHQTSYEVRKRKEANGVKAYREIDLTDRAAEKFVSNFYIFAVEITLKPGNDYLDLHARRDLM